MCHFGYSPINFDDGDLEIQTLSRRHIASMSASAVNSLLFAPMRLAGSTLGEWAFFDYDVSTGRRIAMCRILAVFRNRRFARRLGAPLMGVYDFPPYNPSLVGWKKSFAVDPPILHYNIIDF